MSAKKILMPLPAYGFDPTEVAIPWKILSEQGLDIIFATPDGGEACADVLMLKGQRLGIWKPLLRARADAVAAYGEMQASRAFAEPCTYKELYAANFDALLLPGGHDKGVKEYLESTVLQNTVADFFIANKPVAAICHGVVLAARSINPNTGKSVLHNYRTTALLKNQEMLAYRLTKRWLQDYYRTYPEITVEDEVRKALSSDDNFLTGPSPLFRDDHEHLHRGFTVLDRNYLSARWPGDAYGFATRFAEMLV
ncbi:MAG: type 1 glutamine amidotransferase domain-containing protein [Halioglobus sp.]